MTNSRVNWVKWDHMPNNDHMIGTILSYDAGRRVGLVAPETGVNMGFRLEDVLVSKGLAVGQKVSFVCDPEDQFAYRIRIKGAPRALKSRKMAAFLAIFGGALGMHKFYMGYNGIGAIVLFAALFSWILLFSPLLATAGLGVIEGFIYLTMSNEKFEKRYLKGRRRWL